ncbi:MAG: nicotinamide riboside transporter PnuC [Bacteroidales bacterium]|nr:nicotinamide riboside transporter PnuC [Bacteroidales bacterium]
MNLIFDWIIINWVETVAAALGLIGIGLQIKQNPWYWLTAILMVLLYIYVFYVSGFYADMSFQFYYLVVSVYGWIHWVKSREKIELGKLEAFKLDRTQWVKWLGLSSVFFVIIYLILRYLTDSEIPMGDAFTTALSITATWLLARKVLENWLFWIVVNAVSTALYVYKEMYPSVVLFSVLTILAVLGYFKWRKAVVNA